jgi:biotin carboxylase
LDVLFPAYFLKGRVRIVKKLLVIGAGFLQSFVIKKAKKMGYHTITIDKNPNSIGFEYADEYKVVDIIDQEACLKYAISKDIDGVITAATDYGVLSSSFITHRMNLPGLDYEVAQLIKNKYKVRRTLFDNNVDDISQYYEINNINMVDEIGVKMKFPVMVKPCDGSGSKATKRVDSLTELKAACDEAIKASLVGKALIEDFIEGTEFGVESFVYNNEVHVLGVMGKIMTNPPDYAELGHYFPNQLDLEVEEMVKDVVRKAIKSLGINFGAVNMDVLITNDNRICIVDVGARMGGNLIGSHIIPIGTGVDYMGVLISTAVGESIELKFNSKGTSIVTRLLALKPGNVEKTPIFDEIKKECKVDIYHQLKVGTKIREYHNNLDGCGYVVSTSNDIQEATRRADMAKLLIDTGIVRG